jgi:hypothetical protein
MKFASALVLATLLICSGAVERATAQCIDQFSRKDVVEIKVIFKFRNSHYHADWAYKLLNPRLKMPKQSYTVYPKKESVTDKGLEAIFCVDFDDVSFDSNFGMMLGPKSFSVAPRPIEWSDTEFVSESRKKLRVAKMSLIQFLSLDDPDWLLLESVRVLKVLDGNTWILEAILANKSDHPVALQQLELFASHPKRDGVDCEVPDPIQEVTISWNKIISGSDKGAWTKLGDTNVQVKVSYRNQGVCSSYSFEADIPIQHTVAAGQVIRIELKINEMPRTVAALGAPPSLIQWRRFNVSFYPEVYPAWVEVKR